MTRASSSASPRSPRAHRAPRVPRLAAVLAISFVAVLALAGCGSSGSDSGGADSAVSGDAPMAEGAPADYQAADAEKAAMEDTMSTAGEVSAGSDGRTVVQERAVIANGAIGLEVDDITATATKIRGLVATQGGQVSAESADTTGTGEFGYMSMDLRVPTDRFDDTMARLAEFGKNTNVSRGTEDVTTQVIDVDARIEAQEASVRRLEALMARAETLRDIVALEGELTRRQAELDSLKGQQAWLRDQTSLSTITVSLTTPETAREGEEPDGFIGGVKRGWVGLGEALGAALTILGLLLPFLLVALVIGLPIWWVRRSRKAGAQVQAPTRDEAPTP